MGNYPGVWGCANPRCRRASSAGTADWAARAVLVTILSAAVASEARNPLHAGVSSLLQGRRRAASADGFRALPPIRVGRAGRASQASGPIGKSRAQTD